MSSEHILVQDEGGVRTVTMNRPDKRNALTAAMYAAMAEALEDADGDTGVGAVLIQGSGGFFSSGNDVKDFLVNPPTGPDSAVFRFLRAIVGCGAPVVAAVEGPAVGIGTTMLLHCDFVYAAPDARFHLPFIDLGLVPEAASSLLLPRLIGHIGASRMLMLGEPIEATEAHRMGLVSGLAAAGAVQERAREIANALAAKPRNALRQTKALMRADRDVTRAVMDREGALFGDLLRSPEAIAAFQAFLMKSAAKG